MSLFIKMIYKDILQKFKYPSWLYQVVGVLGSEFLKIDLCFEDRRIDNW